ncbi:MAG: winged helix-turn-helix transcriptional regulator [Promethearchaeota archaeon]
MKNHKIKIIGLLFVSSLLFGLNYIVPSGQAKIETVNGFERHDFLSAHENATYIFNNSLVFSISTNSSMELRVNYDDHIRNQQVELEINASERISLNISVKTAMADFGLTELPENPTDSNKNYRYSLDCIYQMRSNESIHGFNIRINKGSQSAFARPRQYVLAIYEESQDSWELIPTIDVVNDSSTQRYLESDLSNLDSDTTYYFTVFEIVQVPIDLTGVVYIVIFTTLLGVFSLAILISKKDYIKYLKTRTVSISPGPHRLTLEEVLENENRSKIIDIILKEPGIHFNELLRRTQLAAGNLVWHLEILDKYKVIGKKDMGRYVVYFPYYQKNPISNIDLKLQKSRLTLEILEIIEREPGLWNSVLSKRLNVDHKTILYHINKLMDLGLISFKKEGRKKKFYPNLDSEYFNGNK